MILDFAFVFLFLITCVIGFKRGFSAMALAFSAFILSIIAAYFLYGTIYDVTINSYYGKQLESNITQYISEKVNESTENNLDKLNLPVFIKKDIKQTDISGSARVAAKKVVKILGAFAAMIASYILARFIVFAIKRTVRSVTKLPVINVADSIFGFVFGSLTGIIWCAVLYFFVSYLTLVTESDVIGEQYYSSIFVIIISDFLI